MNAQDLKNSILQLAIQGKLVEQRSEEGTAEELYEQIQEEKARLIGEGKIKKEKVLPEIIEDEIPFEIPESWKWVNLECISFINGGYAFKSSKYTENGVRIIRISDFNEAGFVNNKIVRYPYDAKIENYKLDINNIIMCMTGGTVGKSYFISEIDEPMFTNQRVATIKINSKIIPEYVNFVVLAPLTQECIGKQKNSTNDNISMNTIKAMKIPLPPLEEQKRIVAKVEELLPIVEKYGVAQSNLDAFNKKFPEDMQKSILQYAIQGKLVEQRPEEGTAHELYEEIQVEKSRLIAESKIKKEKALPEIKDDEIPFGIPESWKWVRLGNVVNQVHYGYTASAKETGNCKLVRITDIKDNSVNWGDVPFCDISDSNLQTYVLKNRDILIARTGGTIGKTYIVDELDEHAVFASYLIRVIPVGKISERYLKKFMESPLYWSQLKEKSMGTGQPNVNGTALKNLVLPLPPLGEQKRIVSKIEELLQFSENLKNSR